MPLPSQWGTCTAFGTRTVMWWSNQEWTRNAPGTPVRVPTECAESPSRDGQEAVVYERFGPFVSRGGYDWWSFNDVFAWSSARRPSVVEFWTGAEDARGTPLPYPPMHPHHVNIVPYKNPHDVGQDSCTRHGHCQDPAVLLRFYEDDLPPLGEEATWQRCARPVQVPVTPIMINFEFNDVRANGSRPLQWWFRLALRLRHDAAVASVHTVYQPVSWSRHGLLRGYQFAAPLAYDAAMYFVFSLPRSGHIVRLRPHMHMAAVARVLVFDTPDVGLPPRAQAHVPVPTTALGFATADALEAHVTAEHTPVCTMGGTLRRVASYPFAWVHTHTEACFPNISVAAGHPFTALGLLSATALGKEKPGTAFDEHIMLTVEYADVESHYTAQFASYPAGAMDPVVSWLDYLKIYEHGGTPGPSDEWFWIRTAPWWSWGPAAPALLLLGGYAWSVAGVTWLATTLLFHAAALHAPITADPESRAWPVLAVLALVAQGGALAVRAWRPATRALV